MEEFINDAIESAKNYYNSADKMKHSRTILSVNDITQIGTDLYVLHLSAKPTHIDSACLCIKSPFISPELFGDFENRYISNRYFSLVGIDLENSTATLQIKDKLKDIFSNISKRDIELVSDLKFLIKNIEEWYKEYGHLITAPPMPSLSNTQIFFRESDSTAQKNAVKTSLSNSISYIWGAPGTGKTQTVLANCVMSYINLGKQVIIAAPTNNALEQTLRGLIHTMEEHRQNIDVIYRMGTSSQSFSTQYASICERLDRQNKIETLKSTIKNLKAQQDSEDYVLRLRYDYATFKSYITEFNEKTSTYNSLAKTKKQLSAQLDYNNMWISAYKKTLSDLTEKERLLNRRENSVFFKMAALLKKSKLKNLKEKKEAITLQKNDCLKKITEFEIANKAATISRDQTIRDMQDLKDRKFELSCRANEISSPYVNVSGNLSEISLAFSKLVNDKASIEIDSDISNKIRNQEEQLQLLSNTVIENVKDKLVFACTLDYLYAHYKNLAERGIQSALISHVFLDEAAYCPLIKAGVLFSLNAPVTLLGDHMQLPPICEAADRVIKDINTKIFLWSMSAIDLPRILKTASPLKDLFDAFSDDTHSLSDNIALSSLPYTFRFGDNLASILNHFIYKNDFSGRKDIDTRITIINTERTNFENELRSNTAEAIAIQKYIQQNDLDNYVVLTPYKKQRSKLNDILRGIADPDNILTIHASQGREWDTVIISVVDTNRSFLTNSNIIQGLYTINTAISRAKKHIIIVCDYDYWSKKSNTQLIGKLATSGTLLQL